MSSQQRSNSAIIASFIEAKHALDIEVQEKRLGKIKQDKITRSRIRASHLEAKKKKKSSQEAKSAAASEKFRSMDEHKIKLEDLYQRMGVTYEKGLTTNEVEMKFKTFGPNVLTEKKRTPWYVEYAHENMTFFSLMLWAGAGFSFFAYGLDESDPSTLYLACVLVIVQLIIATSTFMQNRKSENVMAGFKNFIPQISKCLRNGNWSDIPASNLVPGDIIEVKLGDKIPADIRIISSQEMKVDNSSLTGESDALLRTPECTHPDHPLETQNLAFFGTLCKEGSAKAIVIATGDRTVIGQIAGLATASRATASTLTLEINRFIFAMSIIAFTLGATFFVLGFIMGYPAVNNIVFAIGIVVSNVPEGLLSTLTVAVSMAAQRLAKAKVLVKNLDSVETLGCTTVICSDKTGTLTQNRMTVANIWYDNKIRKGDNKQKFNKPDHKFEYDINEPGFKALHECAVVSSEAFFKDAIPAERLKHLDDIHDEKAKAKAREKAEQDWEKEVAGKLWLDRPVFGDASETALVKFFQPIEDITVTRNRHPSLKMADGSLTKMPFNSTNKFAINITQYETEESHHCAFIKGAPEKIWDLCSHIEFEGKSVPIDDYWRDAFKKVNLHFGKNGERVLGFAKYHLPNEKFRENFIYNVKNVDNFNFPMDRFSFCGLISLIDPPREIVPFSVDKCQSAGIQVIMVTGDQPITAAAIARKVHIFNENVKTVNEIAEEKGISIEEAMEMSDAIVVHGDMITKAMNEDEELPERERGKKLASWLSKPQVVFARTTPAQKLIIVQGCQNLGNIVAVTGDGVNDSPAIKKADIGVAMGITGSDVAKDAADMVLLTDDFSAIVVGVEEGRKVMDNLKKCLVYSMSSNIPEMTPFMSMVIFGFPLPLSTVLVLCIDLGTDMFPGFAQAFEQGELDLMTRKPRGKTDHLFTLKLLTMAYAQMGSLQVFGAFLTYFYVMADFGIPFWSNFYLQFKPALLSSKTDPYDPYRYDLGNSKVGDMCEATSDEPYPFPDEALEKIDWLYTNHAYNDIRNNYIECDGKGAVQTNREFSECRVRMLSPITDLPVCHTTELLKYAQTSFFFAIVIGQYVNIVSVKTKKLSIYYQGFNNYMLPIGVGSELILTILLAYLIPIQRAFGTRDVTFLQYGWACVPFAVMQMVYDECRKYMIRNAKAPSPDKPNWWVRNYYF